MNTTRVQHWRSTSSGRLQSVQYRQLMTALKSCSAMQAKQKHPAVLQAVKDAFNERPSWLYPHLQAHLVQSEIAASTTALDSCLAVLTYRFSAGPWKQSLWFKGIDPRSSAAYAKYQVLSATLPETWKSTAVQFELTSLASQALSPWKPVSSQWLGGTESNAAESAGGTNVAGAACGTAAGGAASSGPVGGGAEERTPPVATSYRAVCKLDALPATRAVHLQVRVALRTARAQSACGCPAGNFLGFIGYRQWRCTEETQLDKNITGYRAVSIKQCTQLSDLRTTLAGLRRATCKLPRHPRTSGGAS